MCTAISYRKENHYFGRTLDAEFTCNEKVVITPRRYLFQLVNGTEFRTRYALIGMAAVMGTYPLYYEAANEAGLGMAGLNFPGNAYYGEAQDGMDNIAPFEIIPWILGQAKDLAEARVLLERLNLTKQQKGQKLPLAPLHFMLSDKTGSIVVEPMESGLHIYEDPYDVMTNNPPFPFHLANMHGYLNLSPRNRENTFSAQYPLENYGVGMGALGLPGDVSSASRFVRAAFNLTNSQSEAGEEDHVTQFFHVMDSVSMVRGATFTDEGKLDLTSYTSCINMDRGIYYYKTYENNQITAVRMDQADLDGENICCFDLRRSQQIRYEN